MSMEGVTMEDSILLTIKKLLGLESDYDVYDSDLIVLINTSFLSLLQLGIGPKEGFMITGATEIWSDYIGQNVPLRAVQSYIYLKTKTMFDPPESSFVLNAMSEQMKELEFRLNIYAEEAAREPDSTTVNALIPQETEEEGGD